MRRLRPSTGRRWLPGSGTDVVIPAWCAEATNTCPEAEACVVLDSALRTANTSTVRARSTRVASYLVAHHLQLIATASRGSVPVASDTSMVMAGQVALHRDLMRHTIQGPEAHREHLLDGYGPRTGISPAHGMRTKSAMLCGTSRAT